MTASPAIHVLMIDDDENDAMLVRHMVGKMPDSGCQFHWAGSYEQGLKVLGEIHWDLCLLDYQLGAHTGVDVVTESRARGVNTPFLLLTGAGSRAIDLQAMRAGVVGYMEKSRLCPQELERAMRYAIGSHAANPQSAIPVSKYLPPEAVELLRTGFASKKPFVVIVIMPDRDFILRNHLSSRYMDRIAADLESLVRARISSGETLFRTDDGALLLVSRSQGSREARQFLAQLLSEPMATCAEDRSQTVSLPAIVRRSVFASPGYLSPSPLLADLDAFFAVASRKSGFL